MKYGSVCSGIEAASVAWGPLGWRPAFFAEIDPFPSAVLAHHYPTVPNHGDFTRIQASAGPVDLLVGGTPCQDFSVAGLRAGLDGERGNLTLEYLRLADRLRPRWLVWENVPGVLSRGGGRDFGAILGALGELGYGFAYRVLDAQYFGVPQRRRRVFIVGHLGDWRRAAAVLFESESLRRDPPPRRKAWEEVAGTLGGGSGSRGWAPDTDRMTFVPATQAGCCVRDAVTCHAAKGGDPTTDNYAVCVTGTVAHTLKAEGFDASEDGTGRGQPIIAFDAAQITSKHNRSQPAPGKPSPTLTKENANCATICFSSKDHGADAGPLAPTLRAGGHSTSHANAGAPPAIAFHHTQDPISGDVSPCLQRSVDGMGVAQGLRVRRLTPRECERLQGFPDDWTLLPKQKRKKLTADDYAYIRATYPEMTAEEAYRLAKDGPRYKAIGNSMAVPVMRWIGRRIDLADAMDLRAPQFFFASTTERNSRGPQDKATAEEGT